MKKTLTTSLLALALTAAPAVMAAPPPGVGANRAPPRVVQRAPAQVRPMPVVRPLSRAQYESERRKIVRQIDKQEKELSKAQRKVTQAQRKRNNNRAISQAQREERQVRIALAELRQDLRLLDRNNPRHARFQSRTPMRRG